MKRSDWEAFKVKHPYVLSDPLWVQTQLVWEGGDEGRLFLVLLPYVGAKAGDRHELIDLSGLHQLANMPKICGPVLDATTTAFLVEVRETLYHAPGGHGLQIDGLSALISDGKVDGAYVQGMELTY